jgi:hypothetical protein
MYSSKNFSFQLSTGRFKMLTWFTAGGISGMVAGILLISMGLYIEYLVKNVRDLVPVGFSIIPRTIRIARILQSIGIISAIGGMLVTFG